MSVFVRLDSRLRIAERYVFTSLNSRIPPNPNPEPVLQTSPSHTAVDLGPVMSPDVTPGCDRLRDRQG